MPIALFQTESGDLCRMLVDGQAVDALVPHAPGLRVPFRFEPSQPSSPDRLTWDLSYLHAELWSTPQGGSRYYASMLPEFTTREHRPHVMRFPIDATAFAQMEEMRQGGDLNVVLHVQATLVGTLPRDRVPDAAREDMEHVLEVRPGNRHALYVTGLAAAGDGDAGTARERWTRLRDLFPAQSPEYRQVQVLLESLGQ